MATITTFPVLACDNNAGIGPGARREVILSVNNFLDAFAAYLAGYAADAANLTTGALSTGTTNTLALAAQTILIAGVPTLIAAQTAQAISGGATKALKWGLYAVDRVAAGTTTFVAAAGNGTGYATEALAIAAMPAKTANKARVGYFTLVAGASDWTAGTDGLALGSGGTVATTTNFYNTASLTDLLSWPNVVRIGNTQGNELLAGVY